MGKHRRMAYVLDFDFPLCAEDRALWDGVHARVPAGHFWQRVWSLWVEEEYAAVLIELGVELPGVRQGAMAL